MCLGAAWAPLPRVSWNIWGRLWLSSYRSVWRTWWPWLSLFHNLLLNSSCDRPDHGGPGGRATTSWVWWEESRGKSQSLIKCQKPGSLRETKKLWNAKNSWNESCVRRLTFMQLSKQWEGKGFKDSKDSKGFIVICRTKELIEFIEKLQFNKKERTRTRCWGWQSDKQLCKKQYKIIVLYRTV